MHVPEKLVHHNQAEIRKGSERMFRLLSIVWLLTLIGIGYSSVHDTVQATLSDPVFFRLREKLHRTPELSPRLKVYGLDDQTVGFLGNPEISTKDFSLLLSNIAKQKPKAILLDKLFGSSPADADFALLIDELKKQNIPLYSGASIHPAPLNYRRPNELPEEIYGLDKWIEGDIAKEIPFLKDSIHNMRGYLYGYDTGYEGLFKGMGNLGFDRIGSVYPIVVFGDKIIPHLSLYAAGHSEIENNQLKIDGHPIPLNEKGGVVVNHRPVSDFYKKMKSMKAGISRARNNQPEEWVKEGDVVVILFNFYTGSTDFLEGAPFGNLPGGLLVSTLVDSVLENRWVTPLGHVAILIVIMSVIGSILARTTGPVMYWPIMIFVGFLYFCLAIWLFAYQDIMMAWVLPLFGLAGGGTIQYVRQRLGSEIKTVAMQNQLLVERALRLEEEKTNLQLAEKLNLGRAVQQILLPPLGSQEHGEFTFAMSYTPNQEMSGDWLYVWGKDKEEKRIIVGDVVGKGPSAAIPVAILIGILGECEREDMGVEESFQHLNKRILALFGKQVTCSCSAIVMRKGSSFIDLYNAGSPGWFLRGQDKIRHVSLRSTTLGMGEELYIAKETLEIKAGEFLFTFTDGYMEGARAFKRLITKLGTIDHVPEIQEMQDMLDDVGSNFRLEDDKSLLVVASK